MMYGRYQVIHEIGKGAMGKVYKAHDPNLDLFVALKVLRHDCVDSEPFVKRFLKEARVLGRLDRANIVRVYNVDEDRGNIYIAMEFVEGESLRDIMKKKKFTPEEIARFGATIANVLDYAHQQGVVHRDVKPSNILIRSDNFLKVTDFGIAHIQDPDLHEKTRAGEILGTPTYMSPEQIKGITLDGRSDLFSLGIILYELCTDVRPFEGEHISAIFHAILEDKPVSISTINPHIPAELSHVIMKCLNKKPDERFQSGKQLADVLEGYLGDQQGETVVLAEAGSQKKSGKHVLYALIICVAIALTGGLFYYFSMAHKSVLSGENVAMSFLKVESSPAGAQVFIDDMYKGNTPIRIELPTGKHEVRLTAPNHYDWEAQVHLKEEEEIPLNVQLAPVLEG